MRTKLCSVLFIFLFLGSCKDNKPKNELEGNWYGFDSDSSYYELYISDTLIILNHENMGFAEYIYKRDGNRVITTTPLFFERVWTLKDINDTLFILSDTLETHHYHRLMEPIDFFGSIVDSLEYISFKEKFSERIKNHKK
ncbi:hypothetical protein [Shivajiella indica]|uniref:Lipocalin-like domain-containing protein n=1 Tax=Shivajiella indica TaxID=872115 RepID=A0ABW5B412_9BACT